MSSLTMELWGIIYLICNSASNKILLFTLKVFIICAMFGFIFLTITRFNRFMNPFKMILNFGKYARFVKVCAASTTAYYPDNGSSFLCSMFIVSPQIQWSSAISCFIVKLPIYGYLTYVIDRNNDDTLIFNPKICSEETYLDTSLCHQDKNRISCSLFPSN